MGCTPSKFVNVYSTNKKVALYKREFEVLCLSEADVGKLFQIFQNVDVDGSGNIELAELLVHLDVERTPFTKRIFSLFDEDGSGEIDFREFVLSVWNYCSLGKATLVLFAFDIYDRDGSGNISANEVYNMLKDVYGKGQVEKNQHARAIAKELEEMEALGGDIDPDKFRHFVQTHPALLFPAFLMQESIQKACLGVEFWSFHSEKRMELSNGSYISIAKFMEIHLNKDLKGKFLGSGATSGRVVKLLSTTGSLTQRRGSVSETRLLPGASQKTPSTSIISGILTNNGNEEKDSSSPISILATAMQLSGSGLSNTSGPAGRRFSIATSQPSGTVAVDKRLDQLIAANDGPVLDGAPNINKKKSFKQIAGAIGKASVMIKSGSVAVAEGDNPNADGGPRIGRGGGGGPNQKSFDRETTLIRGSVASKDVINSAIAGYQINNSSMLNAAFNSNTAPSSSSIGKSEQPTKEQKVRFGLEDPSPKKK